MKEELPIPEDIQEWMESKHRETHQSLSDDPDPFIRELAQEIQRLELLIYKGQRIPYSSSSVRDFYNLSYPDTFNLPPELIGLSDEIIYTLIRAEIFTPEAFYKWINQNPI